MSEKDQGLECAKKGITGFDFGVCEIETSYCHVMCCASCTYSSASFASYRCQVEYYCNNPDILQAAFERNKEKFDFVTERAKWIEVLPFGYCGKHELREKLEMA